MSKRPRQSRHRIPDCALTPKSEPIDDHYQAEIDASIEHLERRYRKAQKALEAAEAKAERSRQHAERLAQQQVEADRIAVHRAAEEQRANEYVARIKDAAKNARIASAKAELDRQHQAAIIRRNLATAQRKADAKQRLEREQLIRSARNRVVAMEAEVHERRREFREIERLMMPGNYAGRNHRGTGTARHNSGRSA